MLSKPATMLLGLIYEKPLNAYEIMNECSLQYSVNTEFMGNV